MQKVVASMQSNLPFQESISKALSIYAFRLGIILLCGLLPFLVLTAHAFSNEGSLVGEVVPAFILILLAILSRFLIINSKKSRLNSTKELTHSEQKKESLADIEILKYVPLYLIALLVATLSGSSLLLVVLTKLNLVEIIELNQGNSTESNEATGEM